ncbi:hypothetical protein [Actinosynnema pretiosum]|uniref:hypothetical protein n=1 Tax=Actinosynnema pretiosum TaxID=42197 RepID=UPI0012FDB48D|nr:hypothetical protein [Actinosynnema pretiosum]
MSVEPGEPTVDEFIDADGAKLDALGAVDESRPLSEAEELADREELVGVDEEEYSHEPSGPLQ